MPVGRPLSIPRRALLAAGGLMLAEPAWAATPGERLAEAARTQVGVTRTYDPEYRKLAYPGGDPPRTTGVCSDVVIRAARDGLGLDLQRLVHEDMARAFAAYPSRRVWGLSRPDRNIDHRRVLNLEAFWRRAGAEAWTARRPGLGSDFGGRVRPGDILTWMLAGGLPHVGLVVRGGTMPAIVHNIGQGAQEALLLTMAPHRPRNLYRWPKAA